MYDEKLLSQKIAQFKEKTHKQNAMVKEKVAEIDNDIADIKAQIDAELKALVGYELSENIDAQEKSNKLLFDLRHKLNDLDEKKEMYLTIKNDRDFVKDEIREILSIARAQLNNRQVEADRLLKEAKEIDDKIEQLKKKSEELHVHIERLSNVDDSFKFIDIIEYIPGIENVPGSFRNLYINDLISGRDTSRYFIKKQL